MNLGDESELRNQRHIKLALREKVLLSTERGIFVETVIIPLYAITFLLVLQFSAIRPISFRI